MTPEQMPKEGLAELAGLSQKTKDNLTAWLNNKTQPFFLIGDGDCSRFATPDRIKRIAQAMRSELKQLLYSEGK